MYTILQYIYIHMNNLLIPSCSCSNSLEGFAVEGAIVKSLWWNQRLKSLRKRVHQRRALLGFWPCPCQETNQSLRRVLL